PDLACRWNCKAGKCGSCSAEINGKPRLMCMTRMKDTVIAEGETVTVKPLKTFPLIKDLVTDVSFNYRVNKKIKPLQPKPKGPDHIKITDNAIIPLEERVVDNSYDPLMWAWRKLTGKT